MLSFVNIRVILFLLSLILSCLTNAQTFPTRPIRLIVGYAAGGGTDLVARALAPSLEKAIGQPIIIENKPGAGGSAAALFVSKSAPDGYNLLISSASSVLIYPTINPKVGYSHADFSPISQITVAPLVLAVNKDLGVRNIEDFIKLVKETPNKFNYTSSGIGSGPHFAGVYFNQMTGLKAVHVPFKSGSAAVISVVSGESQYTFATMPSAMPLIRSGKLLGLSVSSKNASSLTPDIPGMSKAGLTDYEFFQWNGVFAPAGLPQDIKIKLFNAIKAAMNSESLKRSLESEGTEVFLSTSPDNFTDFIKSDIDFYKKLVKENGAQSFQ